MKFLSLLFCFFLWTLGLPAHSSSDPVFPWPLSSSIRPLEKENLPGSWGAYKDHAVWQVEIQRVENFPETLSLRLRSYREQTHQAFGWVYRMGPMFLGNLIVESESVYGAILYRDIEGMKLRLFRGFNYFYDLRLYKEESEFSPSKRTKKM